MKNADMPGRPFAAQARQLCPESEEHHAKVWCCETCSLLEMRLTPVTHLIGDLLEDVDLHVTYHREVRDGRIVYVSATEHIGSQQEMT